MAETRGRNTNDGTETEVEDRGPGPNPDFRAPSPISGDRNRGAPRSLEAWGPPYRLRTYFTMSRLNTTFPDGNTSSTSFVVLFISRPFRISPVTS